MEYMTMKQEEKTLNKYERILSYLYRYEHGEKQENSGYARVERRDQECRISIQVKLSVPVKEVRAYLYIQQPSGIRTVEIGSVQMGRNEMRLKAKTEIGNLFGSGKKLDDIDGIFLYGGVSVCYATTWKNDYFYQGDWRQEKIPEEKAGENSEETLRKETGKERMEKETKTEEKVIKESAEAETEGKEEGKAESEKAETIKSTEEKMDEVPLEKVEAENEEVIKETREREMPMERAFKEDVPVKEVFKTETSETETAKTEISEPEAPEAKKTGTEEAEWLAAASKEASEGKEEASEEKELQMQSVCGECPLKKEAPKKDYGSRILRTFPTMYPFKDTERGSCVKMELQDIGCLPMRFWSLSGNRFLLHGYYCYRHLLFFKDEQGIYTLGVPGIYNEKEFKNSIKYGFPFFKPIGEEKRHGAFGYWLMKLE